MHRRTDDSSKCFPNKRLIIQSPEPEHTNSSKAWFEWCGFPSLWGSAAGKAGSRFVGRVAHMGPDCAGPSTPLFRPTHWDPLLL